MKHILLLAAALSLPACLTSCEQFKAFVIANQSAIVTAAAEGARIGATAGIDRLKKPVGKNPVEPVQP